MRYRVVPNTRTTTPRVAKCMQCGYAIGRLPAGLCPECGRAFDPGDPSSYRHPGRWSQAQWDFVRPPGFAFHCVVVLFGVLHILVDASLDRMALLLLFPAWLVMGAIWSIRLLVRLYALWSRGKLRMLWRYRPLAQCLAPMLVLSFAALAWFDVPFRVRFELSKSSLDAIADDAVARRPVQTPRGCGLFSVSRIECHETEAMLVIGHGFMDEYILIRDESLDTPITPRHTEQRLGQRWKLASKRDLSW